MVGRRLTRRCRHMEAPNAGAGRMRALVPSSGLTANSVARRTETGGTAAGSR